MIYLDSLIKYQFSEQLDLKKIKNSLQAGEQIILIRNFPTDDSFYESFINQIGETVNETRNNQSRSIFEVKVTLSNGLFPSIANSNLSFPLHTDCADFYMIPNTIGLLCVQPDDNGGGISHFAPLKTILKSLENSQIEELLHKKWSFINKKQSILNKKNEDYTICYDRITMESFSKLVPSDIEFLNRLDNIFKTCLLEIELKRGDLLLFRNDLFLHGRSGFDVGSKRLIKRVRLSI